MASFSIELSPGGESFEADAGETVRVESASGEFLAWAAFSPTSKIRARVWSFDVQQQPHRRGIADAGTDFVARDRRCQQIAPARAQRHGHCHGASVPIDLAECHAVEVAARLHCLRHFFQHLLRLAGHAQPVRHLEELVQHLLAAL